MKTKLLKFKIGLAIIALFTIGLFVFVLTQANGASQDTKTNRAANHIADKLNNYFYTHYTVPASLSEVGVTKVPATIHYQKISANSYKFCITYKTTSSGFDATGAVTDLASGQPPTTSSSDFIDTASLIIPSTHHRGANCQTIKPLGRYNPYPCQSGGFNTNYCPQNN